MITLKQLREQLQISQVACAERTKILPPVLCNIENGKQLPSVEDALALESAFNKPINWQDPIKDSDKREILQSIIVLCERYPIQSVLKFAGKWIDADKDKPSRTISFFAEKSSQLSVPEELVLPPQL